MSPFHECLNNIYNIHESFIIINIQLIKEYIKILIFVYFLTAFISIYYIFFNINKKSVLFIKEKKLFHKKHLFYVFISFIILILFLF